MFLPVFVVWPLIINSSYWWSRNVNRYKTLAKLSCQVSNFLELTETSSLLWREKPAPDTASHAAILSVNRSATQCLTSWLWWGIGMLKTRLMICCSDQALIYRDLVAVRRGEKVVTAGWESCNTVQFTVQVKENLQHTASMAFPPFPKWKFASGSINTIWMPLQRHLSSQFTMLSKKNSSILWTIFIRFSSANLIPLML